MKLGLWVILLAGLSDAFGFAENTVKGYPNCMACHISPTGGGLLTNYGRSLSAELMSTWSVAEGFEQPFYGLGGNTEHVKWGGQFRAVQVNRDTERARVGKLFAMQNNLEFAVQYLKAFAVASVGTQEGPESYPNKGGFLSERHYLLWPISNQFMLRVGKFRQPFGINSPNHTRLVRKGFFAETYNLELSRFSPWGEVNASVGLRDGQESASLALNYTHYGNGDSRFGASLFWGEEPRFGLNAIFPIGKYGVGRSELIYERGPARDAFLGDHAYGYQFFKGGLVSLLFEHGEEYREAETRVLSPGIGFQFLPAPHFEFQFEYLRKSYLRGSREDTEHFSLASLHLYH